MVNSLYEQSHSTSTLKSNSNLNSNINTMNKVKSNIALRTLNSIKNHAVLSQLLHPDFDPIKYTASIISEDTLNPNILSRSRAENIISDIDANMERAGRKISFSSK